MTAPSLARRQQALGRRVRFVGEAYQHILWEYENNRLIESNKVRQIESLITVPLEALAKDGFPVTSRLVDRFLRTGEEPIRAEAVDGYREIQRRLAAVIKAMEQTETLAARRDLAAGELAEYLGSAKCSLLKN